MTTPRDPKDPRGVVEELEEGLVDVEEAVGGDTAPATPSRRDSSAAVAPTEEPPD